MREPECCCVERLDVVDERPCALEGRAASFKVTASRGNSGPCTCPPPAARPPHLPPSPARCPRPPPTDQRGSQQRRLRGAVCLPRLPHRGVQGAAAAGGLQAHPAAHLQRAAEAAQQGGGHAGEGGGWEAVRRGQWGQRWVHARVAASLRGGAFGSQGTERSLASPPGITPAL